MADEKPGAIVKAARYLDSFLRNPARERQVVCPVEHPSRPNPYCKCHAALVPRLLFYLRAALLEAVLRQPFNAPKLWLLRKLGAKLGEHVYISVRTWIDPSYPELLTIGDDVLIGMEARILMHEYRQKEYRVGTVHIGKGSLIGAFSIIGPGVEIGEGATVAAGSVVGKDVPSGVTVGGNPARPLLGSQKD